MAQRRCRWWRILTVLVLAAGVGRAPAEDLPWGAQPASSFSWLANAPQLTYLKTDVELRRSSYKWDGGATTVWDEETLIPAAGITWKNYVYNPYLLNYSLLFELGYYWKRVGESTGGARTRQLMRNGSATVNLLSAKPYAVTFSYGRSRSDVQADFFSSQTATQETWGVLTGYRAGAVPVTLTMEHTRDDRTGDNQDYATDQLKIGVHAANDRKDGDMTVLDYQFNQYDSQSDSGGSTFASESRSHRALLTDRERFSRSTLYSSVSYNQRESLGADSSDVNAFSNYQLNLAPQLDHFVNLSLSDNTASGFTSRTQSVVTGLNHRLYESLGSHLELHGTRSDNDSAGTTLRSANVGANVSENYNKRLSDWGHLMINLSASYDRTDQRSNGGELTIADEAYALPAAGPMIIRLKTPLVVSITSIVKNNVPLDPGEWTAIRTSDPWQIQFLAGGTHALANGDTVLITYVVQANPTGTYSTHNYVAEVAFRFWHDRAGIRASYLATGNDTHSPGFVLLDLKQYQFGADVGGGAFHADANYTRQHSSLYAYETFALNESYTRPLSVQSTVSVNCYQQWSDFPAGSGISADQAQNLTFFNYMVRCDWHPPGALKLKAEAGLQQQRGNGQDENLLAARTYLDWVFSKLEVHVGFERENRRYVEGDFTRNYAFLRMRRNF